MNIYEALMIMDTCKCGGHPAVAPTDDEYQFIGYCPSCGFNATHKSPALTAIEWNRRMRHAKKEKEKEKEI